MNTHQRELLDHWDAYIYDQQEDVSAIARCVLRRLGDKPMRVFEAACGGGKLAAPIAAAGHDVTGIDISAAMLRYARARAEALPNLHVSQADMLTASWGCGYDAVLLGANLLLNIVTDWDYKQAQKQLVERASRALKPGGHLFVDFDCCDRLAETLGRPGEWVCFEGADDLGTRGRYLVVHGTADDRTRIVKSAGRYELVPRDGEPFIHTASSLKYFPTLEQVCAWLYRSGFTIEQLNGGHEEQPFDADHRRAVIWARKVAV